METILEKNEVITLTVEKGKELSETGINNLVAENKKNKDWFIIVDDNSSNRIVYDRDNFTEELKNGIINGTFTSENKIEGHFKDEEGKWKNEDTTIKNFSKDIKELRMLYNPIWNHAILGLKWGAFIGIGLKILDTTILLGSADPLMAVLFLGAIGLCFIPKIGVGGMVVAGFLLARFTGMNFFMMGISAALVGAILGCLPGMFLGGLIGWMRRGAIPKAHDTLDEPATILVNTIVLPFLGAGGIIYSYFVFFNPWLMSVLE